MKKINEKAEKFGNKNKNLWVFFDELNTCDSMALITEIFINRSFNAINLRKNIRILGACNPYRRPDKKKKESGLQHPYDENEKNKYVYLVNPLPQSLLYYVFNFGYLDEEKKKKYISSIIGDQFTLEEQELKGITEKIIIKCHNYLRKKFDPSVVSLREMARFTKCCEFFMNEYYVHKYKNKSVNKELTKINSIIISVYLCYYLRLIDHETRSELDRELETYFVDLVNYREKPQRNNSKKLSLKSRLNSSFCKYLEKEMKTYEISNFEFFSQILTIEQKFLLTNIEIDKGIGTNKLLRENIFILFVCLITKIPLIILGKPGSGKSLSAQLMTKSMRGKYSNNSFFQNFPLIIQSYFQGSDSSTPKK